MGRTGEDSRDERVELAVDEGADRLAGVERRVPWAGAVKEELELGSVRRGESTTSASLELVFRYWPVTDAAGRLLFLCLAASFCELGAESLEGGCVDAMV